jgi:hypothetical protein
MKKMLKRKVFLLLILILVGLNVVLYTPQGVYAAFKDNGWGTRSAGMGGAFCGVADDASSPLWNPAGLAQMKYPEANFMYSRLYTGLDGVDLGLNYFSYVLPVSGVGAFGIGRAGLISTNLYREETYTFTYASKINNYSPRLIPELYLGLNLKCLSHGYTLDEYSRGDPVFAKGRSKANFTFDIGLLTKPNLPRFSGLSIGMCVENITTPDVGLKNRDRVPLEARVGFAYRLKGFRILKRIVVRDVTPALDFTYRFQDWGRLEDKLNVHLGLEGWFIDRLLGLRMGGNTREVTFGFSFNKALARYFGIQLDYAFIFPLEIVETYGSHRISLTVRF